MLTGNHSHRQLVVFWQWYPAKANNKKVVYSQICSVYHAARWENCKVHELYN